MQTKQIDEIREMFRNQDGSCKLSRSDVLRIVDKLAEQKTADEDYWFCSNCNSFCSVEFDICGLCKSPRQ